VQEYRSAPKECRSAPREKECRSAPREKECGVLGVCPTRVEITHVTLSFDYLRFKINNKKK